MPPIQAGQAGERPYRDAYLDSVQVIHNIDSLTPEMLARLDINIQNFSKKEKEAPITTGFTPANQPIKEPPKMYFCKDCSAAIGKEQALSSFSSQGRALCIQCEEE